MTQRTTKASEIAAFLENAIISGDLPAGIVLRQEQLSEEFGVSRTPVREALRQLVSTGVASFQPHRGVRVRSISHDDLQQAFLIRAELEGLAAEFAAARITEAEVAALRTAEAQCVEVSRLLAAGYRSEQDVRDLTAEWVHANDDFHDVILEASRAPLIAEMARSVRRVFHGQAAWLGNPKLDLLYARTLEQHDQLCTALAEGRPREARKLAREHVLDSGKWFKAILEETADRRGRLFPPGVSWDEDGHPRLGPGGRKQGVAALAGTGRSTS